MDVLGKIVGGSGCAVDGTVAAQNPLSRALDSVLQSQGRHNSQRPQQRAPVLQPGYANDLAAQMQRQHFAQAADAQFLQNLEQQALHRSQMEAAFQAGGGGAPAQMMHPQHHHHAAAMEAAFHESKMMSHRQPPPMMMQHRHEAWVNDFRGGNAMDDAWQVAGKTPHEAAWDEAKRPVPQMYRPQFAPVEQQQHVEVEAQAVETSRNLEAQQASSDMARTMSQNPDPKWQNSEFLQFMNQVSSGEVELDEEKNAVNHAGFVKAEGALEGAWEDASDVHSNRDLYESSWKNTAHPMESVYDEVAAADATLDAAWESEAKAAAPMMSNPLDGAWDDSRTAAEKTMDSVWNDGDDLVRVFVLVGKLGFTNADVLVISVNAGEDVGESHGRRANHRPVRGRVG